MCGILGEVRRVLQAFFSTDATDMDSLALAQLSIIKFTSIVRVVALMGRVVLMIT